MIILSTLVGACGKSNTPTQEALPTTSTPQPAALVSAAPVTPIATVAPVASLAPASPGELSTGLDGLEFDAFVEESYRQLLSRNPETVLVLGLSREYGTPTDQLTDISDEYIRQTQALESEVLSLLQQYDRATMTPEQQLTYDIYAWYLGDKVKGHEFMYDDYPVNVTVFSVHLDLLQFFTDLRPVTNLQEAEDYIVSLAQVDTKFDQLIDGLKRREENGAMLPGFLVSYLIGELNGIAMSPARLTPYFTAFESNVSKLSNGSVLYNKHLLNSAEGVINKSVIPAYQALVKYLEHLQSVTTNDAGVWKFPDGDEYYTYLLGHYTSTDLTADQIHELGLQELERIHVEMRSIFDQLGYPQDESLPELYTRVTNDSGVYSGDEIVKGYEDIIMKADQSIGEAFDLRPSIGVIVVGGPSGGYYTSPAVDGSRPGMFYAQNEGLQPRFSMPTLAYHEAIPGHHFQIAIAQQLDLPSFRRASDFTAYVEGWALYAERLASELGLYGDDLYGELGRLQAEAFRAARLVVDTGIHSRQWTFDKAVDFMVENTGKPRVCHARGGQPLYFHPRTSYRLLHRLY